ncbi:PQQ-binding-like beta-propeller repeat protein [bacterium]|nr:PQQ-binding-like beta-propeller repeat protein [candidate division CSSED10-310 bacterium]
MVENGPEHNEEMSREELEELLKPPSRNGALKYVVLVMAVLVIASVYAFFHLAGDRVPEVAQPPAAVRVPDATKVPSRRIEVRVSSSPAGVGVFHNGRNVGVTPLVLRDVEGAVTLLVNGYEPASRMIESGLSHLHVDMKQMTDEAVSPPAEWGMYMGEPARYRAFSNGGSVRLEQRWSVAMEMPTWSSPVIADGKVFVSSKRDLITAFDLADGSRIWKFSGGGGTDTTPVLFDKDVLVGSNSSSFRAFQQSKGKLRGEISLPAYVGASPITDGEALYVVTGSGEMHAMTPRKGMFKQVSFEEKWRFREEEKLVTAPLLVDGVLYVASARTVYAVRRDSGEMRWRYSAPAPRSSKRNETGGLRLANNGGPPPSCGMVNGAVLFPSEDTLYMMCEDGTAEWSYRCGAQIQTTPVSAGGLVFICDAAGILHSVTIDQGRMAWRRTIGLVKAAPVIVNGAAILGTEDGTLRAIDIHTAEVVFTHAIGDVIAAPPAVTSDTMVVTTASGKVMAFRLVPGLVPGIACRLVPGLVPGLLS